MEYIKEIDEYESINNEVMSFVERFRRECSEIETVRVSQNMRHVRVLLRSDVCICFERLSEDYYVSCDHSVYVTSAGGEYVDDIDEAVTVALQLYRDNRERLSKL
jgi:hypothetical protein